jgi:predicted nucleic acid-binding Zn ribbon protein
MWRRSDRRCTQCQHIEEYWTASLDVVVECSKCGGPTERKLSPISTKFEGVGWPMLMISGQEIMKEPLR